MLTKRKARRLHEQAGRAYFAGVHWRHGQSAAPAGSSPLRIAFDAGRKAAEEENYVGMSVDVWALVYADWLRKF